MGMRSLEPPAWNNNAFTCCPVFPTPVTSLSLQWTCLSHHTSNQSQHLPSALKALHALALLSPDSLLLYPPNPAPAPLAPILCPKHIKTLPRHPPHRALAQAVPSARHVLPPGLRRAGSASYLGLCPMSHLPRAFLMTIQVTSPTSPDPSTIHHSLSVYWLHCIQPLLKLAICYLLPCLIVSLSLLPL